MNILDQATRSIVAARAELYLRQGAVGQPDSDMACFRCGLPTPFGHLEYGHCAPCRVSMGIL